MKRLFFTLTGTNHYYGTDFLERGIKLILRKEPDNVHDKEAIRAEIKGLGKIGYVANSTYTVIGESYSAGRLYEHIGKRAKAKVLLVTERGILCELKAEKRG